jgi:hypothetical protein
MRNFKGLATILLATPALFAQAPAQTPGQRLAAERPEILHLMDSLQYPEAQAKAESLLPATKPVFDKATSRTLTLSTQAFVDTCNTYLMAYQAADTNGQWEKALEYLKTAQALAQENVDSGKEGLTKNRDDWKKDADTFRAFITKNADAIQALHAKTKLEDYEEASMAQVKTWEAKVAEGDKWSKFFQYYLDLANSSVADFTKFTAAQEQKIADQQKGIDDYKAFPGNKTKWVEAVISSKTYFENFSKPDKLSFLYRLAVLDPESIKVKNAINAMLGKPLIEVPTHHKK